MASLIVPFMNPIFVNFSTTKVKVLANELLVRARFEMFNPRLFFRHLVYVEEAHEGRFRVIVCG